MASRTLAVVLLAFVVAAALARGPKFDGLALAVHTPLQARVSGDNSQTNFTILGLVRAQDEKRKCSQCLENWTCCYLGNGKTFCCPLRDGVCCFPKRECCHRGYQCIGDYCQ